MNWLIDRARRWWGRIRARLIADVGHWWRFWIVRIQMSCAMLTGLMYFDLPSLLNVWNMMPPALRAALPGNFVQTLGAILFVLSVLSMLARVAPQAKLEAKRKEGDKDGPA